MESIQDRMITKLVTVKPLDTVAHARKIASEHRINQILVVHHGKLLGIVTDRDMRDAYPSVFDEAKRDDHHARGEKWQPDHITVESIMARDPHTLPPEASLADAARLMRRQRIGAIPIVDANGHAVGLIARSDILDAYVRLAERHTG